AEAGLQRLGEAGREVTGHRGQRDGQVGADQLLQALLHGGDGGCRVDLYLDDRDPACQVDERLEVLEVHDADASTVGAGDTHPIVEESYHGQLGQTAGRRERDDVTHPDAARLGEAVRDRDAPCSRTRKFADARLRGQVLGELREPPLDLEAAVHARYRRALELLDVPQRFGPGVEDRVGGEHAWVGARLLEDALGLEDDATGRSG